MTRLGVLMLWLVPMLSGTVAADENVPDSPPTNWTNIGLIVGIVAALSTAGIALYRASAQRGLDVGTKQKIDAEVKRLQTAHDERRTRRVLRLELYVDNDIDYHRKQKAYLDELTDMLEAAMTAGFIPHRKLPEPPVPPKLPDMPDTSDDAPV